MRIHPIRFGELKIDKANVNEFSELSGMAQQLEDAGRLQARSIRQIEKAGLDILITGEADYWPPERSADGVGHHLPMITGSFIDRMTGKTVTSIGFDTSGDTLGNLGYRVVSAMIQCAWNYVDIHSASVHYPPPEETEN